MSGSTRTVPVALTVIVPSPPGDDAAGSEVGGAVAPTGRCGARQGDGAERHAGGRGGGDRWSISS